MNKLLLILCLVFGLHATAQEMYVSPFIGVSGSNVRTNDVFTQATYLNGLFGVEIGLDNAFVQFSIQNISWDLASGFANSSENSGDFASFDESNAYGTMINTNIGFQKYIKNTAIRFHIGVNYLPNVDFYKTTYNYSEGGFFNNDGELDSSTESFNTTGLGVNTGISVKSKFGENFYWLSNVGIGTVFIREGDAYNLIHLQTGIGWDFNFYGISK